MLLAVAAASFVTSVAEAQLKVVSESVWTPPYGGTKRLVVHSETIGRDFIVAVSAPPADVLGMKQVAGRKLPGVYALDGGFAIAGPLGQMMASQGLMASAYVVAISYPRGDATSRSTDFLHRKALDTNGEIGGGGAKFEAFLTKELRPYLEKRYPLDPEKAILFGHSFGGLFAANVLASDPAAWSGYIIASPSTPWDSEVLLDLSKAAPALKGKRVYVAVGETETPQGVAGVEKVAAILKTAGLNVESRVFAKEGHISYYPQLVPAAFAWILPLETARSTAAAATATLEQLARLVGVYNVDDGRTATFLARDGKLIARITSMPGEAELTMETPTRFAITAYGVVMTFEGAETGPAKRVIIRVGGGDQIAVRQP